MSLWVMRLIGSASSRRTGLSEIDIVRQHFSTVEAQLRAALAQFQLGAERVASATTIINFESERY
jgi:hypothetical protein